MVSNEKLEKKGNCLLSDLPHSYVMWLTIRDTLLYKISC